MGIHVTVSRKTIVNGREYRSVEEMPEDVRRIYLQALRAAGSANGELTINGKKYRSIEEMPADAREVCRGAMASTEPLSPLNDWKTPGNPSLLPTASCKSESPFAGKGPGSFGLSLSLSGSPRQWLVLGTIVLIALIAGYFLKLD